MATKLTAKSAASLPLVTSGSKNHWDTTVKGFGVRCGKHRRTYFYSGRMLGEPNAKKRNYTIGVMGEDNPATGKPWTFKQAQQEARDIKAMLDKGIAPRGDGGAISKPGDGLNLRDALELHLSNMEKKKRSPRSIATVRGSIEKHLKDWLDRPMAELTAKQLTIEHDRIIAETKPKSGSVNPAGHASAKRIVTYVGTLWDVLNNANEGALGNWNPRNGVVVHKLAPRSVRLGDKVETNMSWDVWYQRVMGLNNGIRRDIQLLALFTGIRSEGVCNILWDDIDLESGLLTVRVAKSGKPYVVPICQTHRDIFARRKAENPDLHLFPGYEGDGGWVFPTFSVDKPGEVQPTRETKEWRIIKGERVQWLPGIHPLRRTYASTAAEVGVTELTIKVLMNHALTGVTGKHYIQTENYDTFLEAQCKIEAALWVQLTPADDAEAAA